MIWIVYEKEKLWFINSKLGKNMDIDLDIRVYMVKIV